MTVKTSNIYQFKITLKEIKPKIWRRIQVPASYSFNDLHVAIQNAMGWYDTHLHQFEITNPNTGFNLTIGDDECDVLEQKAKIAKYFLATNKKAIYDYDFGDYWQHEILLEKILPADVEINYPQCIGGERSCPPEDCGGAWGYKELLEIMKNPGHADYEERMEWLGKKFDPEMFDPETVVFEDPKERVII